MITSILKQLNGHGSELASLEAAMLKLGRERNDTRAKIASLQSERHQLLLDDASDKDLDKVERELDRAMVKLEKQNAAEAPLLQKITAARSGARQRLWSEIRAAYLIAAADFLAAARATAERHTALLELTERAQRAGFEGEVAATMPNTPNMNGNAVAAPELLDQFERALSPSPVARTAASPPIPRRSITAAEYARYPGLPGKTLGSMQHEVRYPDLTIAPQSHAASRTPDDLTELAPGEARVMALNNGWSPRPDRSQCHAGQKLKMPLDAAEEAAKKGFVEIIEKASAPSVAASEAAQSPIGVAN